MIHLPQGYVWVTQKIGCLCKLGFCLRFSAEHRTAVIVQRFSRSFKQNYIVIRKSTSMPLCCAFCRADVDRSTFYAHFQDKEDLMTAMLARMMDGLKQMGAICNRWVAFASGARIV
jgi:hypothetical protein